MVAYAYSPSPQEAEVGGALEPRHARLQFAMIMPLQSSLGDEVTPYLKKKKNCYFLPSDPWKATGLF